MRLVLAISLFALVTCLGACGVQDAPSPDFLFAAARSDVHALKGEGGREIGLVNTTHNVAWDYARGYSRFGADRQIIWGPLASFPEAELASMQAVDAPQSTVDDVGSVRQELRPVGETTCSCCYVRLDGTCGCYLCKS